MPKTEPKRGVVLVDWDNTLRAGFTVTAWAEYLAGRDLFSALPTIVTLFDRFRNDASYDYEVFCGEMAAAYAEGLAGQSRDKVLTAAASFVRVDNHHVFGFVRSLCEYFAERQLSVIVLSGAPEEPLTQYASTLGFELAGALRLEVEDGRYTGHVIENCGLSHSKHDAVVRVSSLKDVVVALGDSLSDMPLLNAASVGFVVRGAAHHSVPAGPRLFPFDSDSDPSFVVEFVKQRLADIRALPKRD